ncbi:MAG: hypothetical protein QOH59_2457 [Gemmatimonadales bacterium]|jgi:uncharacterized protein (DUF58 family)|nr:hypothetical protein [Gemmatimonadales bacterium]
MWLRTIFRRRNNAATAERRTALDEHLLRRLERLVLATSRALPGGLSGEHASRRRMPAPTFSDHRPYSTGDDLRYIDWNAYGRLEHLHLKIGEAEQDVRVTLLLDCSASMNWGEGDQNKLHFARLLTAAIGYIALATGDHLQVVPFGSDRPNVWGPASSRNHATSLLVYLQRVAAAGTTGAAESIARLAHGLAGPRDAVQRGGLLVVISDLLHSEDLQTALRVFHAPRWQVLMLHVLHPHEMQPNVSGDVDLQDSETEARLSLHIDDRALAAYAAAVEQWCEHLESDCARHGQMYARLTTDMSLERAALAYLRQREILR